MSTVLDWSRFDTGPVGPERAFEAFTAQLFERWLRREHWAALGQQYVLHGAGGDGGVEAFATLKDGTVIGLQAKWFPGNVDDERISQIRASINAASANYPNLRHYIVALPRNLTKGTKGKNGKMRKGGVERWNDLVKDVASTHPGLALVRWDEDGLLEQLAVPGNQEIKALWFEGELTMDVIQLAWTKARKRLGQRYLPDLHAEGQFEKVIEGDLYEPKRVAACIETARRAEEIFRQALTAVVDFRQHTNGRRGLELDDAVIEAEAALATLCNYARVYADSLKRGPLGEVSEYPKSDSIRHLIHQLKQLKEGSHGFHDADLCEHAVEAADRVDANLQNVSRIVREAGRKRVVEGPAGCGKTHAAARAVERVLEMGIPGVFLQAKEAEPAAGIGKLLQDALDLPGWPLGRMLDSFEALALLAQTKPQHSPTIYARGLLVLDGLEEASGWDDWTGPLVDLVVEANRRPRLHIVITMRPETARRLALPSECSRLVLNEDSGVSLPAMLQKYCSRYGVNYQLVPWLGWALRSPLEVRLLAEDYQGRALTVEEGAHANLMNLFRQKLTRLEAEARKRAGSKAWSENLHLLDAVLEGLSDFTVGKRPPFTIDLPLIRHLGEQEPEFTAERVRIALKTLADHGLVDIWLPPSIELRGPSPVYGLATRHISDFVVAKRASQSVLAALSSGKRTAYPEALQRRTNSSILFAAMLAGKGLFLTDDIWDIPPDGAEYALVSALALVPPAVAATRRVQVRELLLRSTASNREVLRRLVIPVSRIPGHPLGPPLFDEALRSMTMADRDSIWSVPDDLAGDGAWAGGFNFILDKIELVPEIDEWNGMPLIAAWLCSSVVEKRRCKARESLAMWGSQRLDQMMCLLNHMANVGDPQIIEDLVVAALGAATAAPFDDPSLIPLAQLVDALFFTENARAWTPDVIVRVAARGIVERAALVHPSEVSRFLPHARPPFNPRGDEWPSIDVEEARKYNHLGGSSIVSGDLSWYVADRCFSMFAESACESIPANARDELDHTLKQAVKDGLLIAPPTLAKALMAEREEHRREQEELAKQRTEMYETWRQLYVREMLAAGKEPEELDEGKLLDWILQHLKGEKEDIADGQGSARRSHSPEFTAFLERSLGAAGITNSPNAVRNGLIERLVRGWGWPGMKVVDAAIEKRHGPGATHGARSKIATFREKYVWAAVNHVAGELADRLPVRDGKVGRWKRLQTLDGIGTGMPDPLPRTLDDGDDGRGGIEQHDVWSPATFLDKLFIDEVQLPIRAERWLVEAPLPDPCTFVRGAIEGWKDAAVLGLSLCRRGHQSCIDQFVQVRAFAVPTVELSLLLRDAPFLRRALHEYGAWVEEGVYASPALACWAPWLTWQGEDQGYGSFDAEGRVVHVSILSMVGRVTARFEGDHPQEPYVWMPSPRLGRHLGVVAMRGGRYLRHYLNRKGLPVAIERDLPHRSFSFDHHYLAMDFMSLVEHCREGGLVPVWAVHLEREATPALWMKGNNLELPDGLGHRSREAYWLVSWDYSASAFNALLVFSELEAWSPHASLTTAPANS
jgi:hypothetical protein